MLTNARHRPLLAESSPSFHPFCIDLSVRYWEKQTLDSIQHGLFDDKHPGYARCRIIQFTSIPSLPNLISLLVERSAWELYQELKEDSSRQTADK